MGPPHVVAQLDLKKAFDKVKHSAIAELLHKKGVSDQLVAILCRWWQHSTMEVRLGHVTADRPVQADRGVPQGAPESPLIFVLVTDEILGSLQSRWRDEGRGWTCDELHLSCLGYADDILLFARSKEDLEAMIADCCEAFGAAGLEVGLEKTHWSSSIDLADEKIHVRGQEIQWERTLEFIGSMTEPCGHNGCSFRHRMKKATAVFQRWKGMLCNQHLSVTKRVVAFRASVIPSATWLSGCWTLTAKQEATFSAWGARMLSQITGHRFRRELHFAEKLAEVAPARPRCHGAFRERRPAC